MAATSMLARARRRTLRLRVGALAALATLVLASVLAAALAPLPAHAQAGITISSVRGLDFGRFAAGQGGSVTLAPGGLRSSTGAVILLPSNSGGAASFHVARSDGAAGSLALSLSLPSAGSVVLSNGVGRMSAGAFRAWPASIASVPDGGIDITVGATLDVAPGQPAGSYSGTFALTVNYE